MEEYFFKATHCDRCGCSLEKKSRTMSMYNKDVLCPDCKEAERKREDYDKACEADIAEIKRGNYNFEGIGGDFPHAEKKKEEENYERKDFV